jgi:histidine triad (HIT) family protein
MGVTRDSRVRVAPLASHHTGSDGADSQAESAGQIPVTTVFQVPATSGNMTTMTTTHTPTGYQCPFCALAAGAKADQQQDVVRRTSRAMAFVSPRWWPKNHGNVLVVPVQHYENLYELPAEAGHAVHDLVRDIAIAMRRTYDCEGVSTRQHNEPAGGQDVWHYHVHVFPRYQGDELYTSEPYREFVTPEQRRPYAERLRSYLAAEGSGHS